MTHIDIISGFLDSGKTTLIQKLLKNIYHNKKVYIILNESGSVKLDNSNCPDTIQVKSVLNGCLCCNNSRDFEMTMKSILENKDFEHVIIELAGTAKLSDLLFIVQEQIKSGLGELAHMITVVDVKSFEKRMNISKHFFEHQLQKSPSVFLSRTDMVSAEKCKQVRERILQLNPDCIFLEDNLENWTQLASPYPNPALSLPDSATRSYARYRIQPHSRPSADNNHTSKNNGFLLSAFDQDL